MPANWMEWLGAIGSITTIIAFAMYSRERCSENTMTR